MEENDLKKIAADILFRYFTFTRTSAWKKLNKKETNELFKFQASCADLLHNLPYIVLGTYDTSFARFEIEGAVSGILTYIEDYELESKLKYSELKNDLKRFKVWLDFKCNY